MKRVFSLLALLVLLLVGATWYAWTDYHHFLEQPLGAGAQGVVLDVEPGMSGRAVIARLAGLGLSEDGWQWRVLLRSRPVILKAGEYLLDPGLTPPGLLSKVERGDVIRYRFTIVEGWNWRTLRDALEADPTLTSGAPPTVSETDLASVFATFGSLEGAFLPETYLYVRGDTAADVLHQASRAMQTSLAEAWAMRAPDHPLKTPYELLILASIVEKETALDSEREQVSGVFVRRLQKGMRLQADPTVIYGLGEKFDGDIRTTDLQADTPYNTYTRQGLPPTPIAMPGRASLIAAARPDESDALYFVADGRGGHTFSATLEEHQRGVDQLTGKN
jgi:UPF0755 protein